jgi:hypothetical protein
MPGLPPGYIYVPQLLPPLPNTQLAPATDPQQREQLYERLRQLDLKADRLGRERIGVGGPIFVMVLGYSTMVVAGLVGLGAASNARDIKDRNYVGYSSDLDFNDDGDVDRGDRNNWVKTARVGAGRPVRAC